MAKTQEELNTKLNELSENELEKVAGGSVDGDSIIHSYVCPICGETHSFYRSPLATVADGNGCSAISYIYGFSREYGNHMVDIIISTVNGEKINTTAKLIGYVTNGQSVFF